MDTFTQSLDVKEMGRRFKLIRHKLGLTQTQVGTILNTTQLMVFRIEKGENVLSPFFLGMMQLYGQYMSYDALLANHFDIEDESLFNKDFVVNKIVKEKLATLRDNVIAMLEDTGKELQKDINAAAGLL
ncbi:MAG: hypothetical protein IKH88_06695 [Prevotella sp.]|nr:hypothetical protein [Prevotella sp.]